MICLLVLASSTLLAEEPPKHSEIELPIGPEPHGAPVPAESKDSTPRPTIPLPDPDHTEPEPAVLPVVPQSAVRLPSDGIFERWERESEALRRLLSLWTLAEILLLILALVGASALSTWIAGLVRATGYDSHRHVVGMRSIAAAGAVLFVAGWVGRELIERLPLVGMGLVGIFLSGLALMLAHPFARAVGAMMVIRGAQLREGDKLTVGDITGTIEHAGLFRVRLRRADGVLAYLPTHQLDEGAIIVSSPQRSAAVRAQISRGGPPSATRSEVHRIVALCPYRQAGSDIHIERGQGSDGRFEVQLQAWSASAATGAERWLHQAFDSKESSCVETDRGTENF